MRQQRGFTLIEVLVALMIMALAFAALLRASGLAADHSARLRLSLQAGWIAENQLAELKAGRSQPAPGLQRGVLHENQRDWLWEQQISLSDDPGLLRVEIRILASEQPRYQLAQLSGMLLRQPVP